jgi:hypothetical protein
MTQHTRTLSMPNSYLTTGWVSLQKKIIYQRRSTFIYLCSFRSLFMNPGARRLGTSNSFSMILPPMDSCSRDASIPNLCGTPSSTDELVEIPLYRRRVMGRTHLILNGFLVSQGVTKETLCPGVPWKFYAI